MAATVLTNQVMGHIRPRWLIVAAAVAVLTALALYTGVLRTGFGSAVGEGGDQPLILTPVDGNPLTNTMNPKSPPK